MLWILFVLIAIGVACSIAFAVVRQKELLHASLVAIILCTPIAITVGYVSGPIALNAAQTGAVSGYTQFLNGTVVDVNEAKYDCYRDGPCTHKYDCDSYQVKTHDAYTDSNKVYHPATYETDYHRCPVATEEYTYTIVAVAYHVYTWNIVDHGFAAHPQAWCCASEVDGDSAIPQDVPRGIPAQWAKAKHDLATGQSDAVTVYDKYPNYILANEATILHQQSGDISMLRNKELLPGPPLVRIHDTYLANKVDFVGLNLPASTQETWQNDVALLNADLGTNLQGDLHVVAVNASSLQGVVSPDDYAAAIQADRLNNYKKDAEAKNTVLLVLGVNQATNTITWARANTGMPIGNDDMLAALQDQLQGVAFDPSVVFGETTAKVTKSATGYHVQYTAGSGIASQIVIVQHSFLRACMNCESARDKKANKGQQSFVYLKTELPLPPWGVVVTIIVDLITLAVAVLLAFYVDSKVRQYLNHSYTRPRIYGYCR